MGILSFRGRRAALIAGSGLVAALSLALPRPAGAQVDLDEIAAVGHLVGEVGHLVVAVAPLVGEREAPVQVVAFTDFACGACGEFARDSFGQLRATLIDSRRVEWRQVPFMLGFRRGREATLAAECAADQGAFWPMHDALFADQDRWRNGRRPNEIFEALARELALDLAAFADCIDHDTPRRRIDASNDAAEELNVRATPTFYIDGRPVLGALSVAQFTALVEAAEAARAGNEIGR